MEQNQMNTFAAPDEPVTPVVAGEKKASGGLVVVGMVLLMIGGIAFGAIGGIAFGVWALMDRNTEVIELKKQVASLTQQNNELSEKILELEGSNKGGSGNHGEDGYIILDEVGIKIKKSDAFPDMTVKIIGSDPVRFVIKESADVADEAPAPDAVTWMQTSGDCTSDEITFGYSALMTIDGVCYAMGEILPYGSDLEYPLTDFLIYVKDQDNYSAI